MRKSPGATGPLLWTAGAGVLLAGGLAAAQNAPVSRTDAAATAGAAFFESRVRPILAAKCYACHSSGKPVQGGLKLDSREAALAGGKRGAAVVPGDPEHSLLVRALSFTHPELQMPPDGRLKEAEIAAVTAWVRMGAPWPGPPRAAAPNTRPRSARPSSERFWAFIPPKAPPLPAVKNRAWAGNPIDRFILAKLEAKSLAPAPPADRRTLIRRATFDLTGLPPTPAEIQTFLADRAPGAFARVVDRLLASPAYGERWGRHWLDVARYADSNGLDENLVYPNAWRYRDYVIRAFNADKPVDRFIQEQLAGDLLPPVGDETADLDRTIATGYLSLGAKMLAEDDPVKQEEDIIDEQVDTLGKTFMGVTLGCARCHDHKFDPFPQTDYYALAGIFKSTRTMRNFKVVAEWQELPLVSAAERERLAAREDALAKQKAALQERRAAAGRELLAEAQRRARSYLEAARIVLRDSAGATALQPVLGTAGTTPPPGGVLLEAEAFVRGNVLKDRDHYGAGIGVLVNAGPLPNLAEYEVTVQEGGAYQLDLRYASADARPVRIYVNDVLVATGAAGQTTGGFFPDAQRWSASGVFPLRAGANRIRLERDGPFPHIDKLLLQPRQGQPYPRTPELAAAEAGLVPEFLVQAVTQEKQAGPMAAPALQFTPPEDPTPLLPAASREPLQRLAAEIQAAEKALPVLPRAMAVSEGTPTDLRVHLRGSYLTLGTECPRGFPVVLAGKQPPAVIRNGSGRRELAQWLTAPEHPLTARVFVNRVWRWHFGRGIVPSTDNFGALGDRPTNQPLLDWLATAFVQDGWSLKRLHRRIMLSNTYQMGSRYDARSARLDPENRLHWRHERRRLEAEALRDAVLAVSGELDRTVGGTLLKFKDREYVTSTANADPVDYHSRRRSVYLPVIRSALYDVYTAFDFGDPTVMNGDRATTTVAPQLLFLMNSSLVLEQTRVLAGKLLARDELDDPGRIAHLYETCYGRRATAAEIQRSQQFLARVVRAYEGTEPKAAERRARAWQSLCKALLAANEFIYVE